MQWIEGMSRQGGKLALQVVDESGGRQYFSPAAINVSAWLDGWFVALGPTRSRRMA
jgi:hypothetical protein